MRSLSDRQPRLTGRRGFTMVELIVVVAIIALLVALAIPAIGKSRHAAAKLQCVNHLRNVAIGLTQFEASQRRYPASGSYHIESNRTYQLHSWAVEILPYVEQNNLYQHLDLGRRQSDPANEALQTAQVPVYVCPSDITRNPERIRDLSYVVNGGVGFTAYINGVRDCPIGHVGAVALDLNGDGVGCGGTQEIDDLDRKHFKQMGMFFLESRNNDVTRRHHRMADVRDGTSQTFLVTENARTGFNPEKGRSGFGDPNPYQSAFYIGNPCHGGRCDAGNVDYSLCNAGQSRINSGLWSAEGSSPVPNSFHEGGVNMAYADVHVAFLAEHIDGAVYAALASPQGLLLNGTPLAQTIVSGGSY